MTFGDDLFYLDEDEDVIELDDLLLVKAVSFDEFNETDLLAECDRMFLCNQHIQKYYNNVLNGTLEPGQIEVLGDVLAECDIDPYIWSENWISNIQKLIASGNDYRL